MDNIISFSKVIAHERLTERLLALRALVAAATKEAPEGVASAAFALMASLLLADLYRLISREPGARALPRLDPAAPPTHRQLAAMLRDASLMIDLFRQAHRDHNGDYGDEWLTREGIDYFRAQRKTYPHA